MAPGDPLKRGEIMPKQHFTEPPPRFTEASLVRKLEELGIGRPSTYASIISVLQDRDYVRLESKRFVPEDRGRLVSAFLVAFFDQYVQPAFTAALEGRLDDIAAGSLHWKEVLREFWDPFNGTVDEVKERRVADVLEALNELLGPQLFPRARGRRRPAGLPALRRRPAQPEVRPLRRLRRLLELPRVPLHPPARGEARQTPRTSRRSRSG